MSHEFDTLLIYVVHQWLATATVEDGGVGEKEAEVVVTFWMFTPVTTADHTAKQLGMGGV